METNLSYYNNNPARDIFGYTNTQLVAMGPEITRKIILNATKGDEKIAEEVVKLIFPAEKDSLIPEQAGIISAIKKALKL